jgi:hypothetical protein
VSQCALSSSNRSCATYESAYNQEVQRNYQLVQAYRSLSAQYGDAVDGLAALASKFQSLQKELDNMYVDVLAQDAVVQEYERQLATQNHLSKLRTYNKEKTRAQSDSSRTLLSSKKKGWICRMRCTSLVNF